MFSTNSFSFLHFCTDLEESAFIIQPRCSCFAGGKYCIPIILLLFSYFLLGISYCKGSLNFNTKFIYQSSIHLLLMIALLPFLCSTVLSFLRVVGWVQDHRIIHQVLAASQGQWLDPEGAWPSWMAQSIDELKNLSRLWREGGTVGGGI